MTYQLTVVYHQPEDPAAFDSYYEGTHAPLALRMPGLQSFTTSRPAAGPDGQAPEVYMIAELRFADRSAFGAAVTSAEGQAATADVPSFATGGAVTYAGEVTTYR